MRLREVFSKLYEDSGSDSSSDSSTDVKNTGSVKGKRGSIHDHHEAAIPGLKTVPDWPGWYYPMYRMGIHLAGSPNNQPNEAGPFKNEMVFTTFTDAEEKMLKHSAKEMGVKLKTISGNKSKEPTDTNTASPVANTKRNRFGV